MCEARLQFLQDLVEEDFTGDCPAIPRLTDAEWARYRGWHDADPPDARDRARNLGILGWQGNANPFIACPQTVHDVVVPRP